MTNYNRVSKFKDLREGLKDEVGINREVVKQVEVEEQEDDFLSFINKDSTRNSIDDTLSEGKTFEQLHQESSKEIEKALKSVKVNVGKQEEFNTRMDILNKIRNPEKEVIRIDRMDDIKTAQFAKGYFIKQDIDEVEETTKLDEVPANKKLTLMERLAQMSPKEDVEQLEEMLNSEKVDVDSEKIESEDVDTLVESQNILSQEKIDTDTKLNRESKRQLEKSERTGDILNYVIIGLVSIFIVLVIIILLQPGFLFG